MTDNTLAEVGGYRIGQRLSEKHLPGRTYPALEQRIVYSHTNMLCGQALTNRLCLYLFELPVELTLIQ